MIKTGLEGKVVLVTGANHGIGAATAWAFATKGAAVFITYLGLPSADEVVGTIRRDGGRAEAWEADLADPATVPDLFDQVERAFAPVDVLVNNAAVGGPPKDTFIPLEGESQGPLNRILQTITSASHDRHFAVNSRAVALMMAEYARRYVTWGRGWGRIINVSTDWAPAGYSAEVSYAASKAAMESYSRAAAQELARYGITVNIVGPGPVQTGWITPDVERREVAKTPLGRIGRPEDVADVIVFLASEQACWLTGQTLFVGGGHRMI